ncbi:putative RNA-directed DNA polymerase [Helianthus annuus]|nr:putative RNA-directed DNA polymerase [Helianthus annuus]KAJ0759824.1 putative RNA-directed DNA polymerase [Helianthus annuus]
MPKIVRSQTMNVVASTSSNPPKENPFPFQCPTLTSSNYTTWAIKMEAIMDAQGLWESIEPQAGVVVDEKKSKTARAFIFQAIPEEILLQVAKKKTAKEVWESLKTRFVGAERVQKARLHTLKSEFESMRMKDGESIDDYAGKLSGMISKYNSVGAVLGDEELVRKLLDTVTDKYIQLVASMEQYSDVEKMPFEEAIGRLKAYEDRLKLRQGSSTGESSLLFTKAEGVSNNRGFNKHCFGRGRGHTDDDRGGRSGSRGGRGSGRGRGGRNGDKFYHEGNRTYRKPRDKSHVKCFECNKYGHYSSECKKMRRSKIQKCI